MNLTAFLLAALVAGLGSVTLQANVVYGGGPIGAPQTASANSIYGGGPSGAPQTASSDSIYGGGPVTAPKP